MVPTTDPDGLDRPADHAPGPGEAIEQYQADEGIVLFDAFNPLAWVESSESVMIHSYR